MIVLKCKSCGDDMIVENRATSVTCPSCGNIYSVPMDEKTEQCLNLYSRADDAWDHKDFEEATELYQQILTIDNTQAEAHFGLVLCKYGITYEIDPVTLKKMPTCNRINRDSILDDKHFRAAIKYASKEAAATFQKRAEEVDRISRDFLKIVDKEKPYDVFISYKRTAEDGTFTVDSKVARKLYYHLKEKGYNVFFAEETLKSAAGEKYEPYIFAALSSSPVMVLVGSRRDHFEATWVKNEWRRYLALMNQGAKKTLIPAYFSMDPYHLPGELRNLQAMNMADITFHEDITEIIRKKVTDARDGKPADEPQGPSLRDKYAPKEKVDKLLDITDCDREFAINVLIQCHGDMKKSQQFIEEDPDYKKSMWVCVECGAHNTHEKCHSCRITKKESADVARARKEMEERQRKNSAAYKQQQAEKIKKILKPVAVIAVIAALFAFLIWPKIIYPNLSNKDFNTPEIVQSYCYSSNEKDDILTITECTPDGQVTATWEFIDDGKYGKVNLTGKIVKKKNNGNVEIEWTSNSVEIMPDGITWQDEKAATIKKKWSVLKTGSKTLKAGANDEYTIASADDFKKLGGSGDTFFLKNDIDLGGANWTPIEGFTGLLLGNGHTIKNLKIDASGSNVGFFSTLNGMVKNLNFENASVTVSGRNENVGILCGKLESGNISDISVSGSISADTCTNVGGIAGYAEVDGNAILNSLENKAVVTGADYTGGIFGLASNASNYYGHVLQLSGFKNSGAISGNERVGGIIGRCHTSTVLAMSEFVNTGDVTGTLYVGGTVGDVAGYNKSSGTDSHIQNSSCSANVTGEAYVGCIAGNANLLINSCKNTGSTLTATKYVTDNGTKYAYVGGFAGFAYAVNDCTNEVDIHYTAGGRNVGGIAGHVQPDGDITMEKLENKATVSGADYTGGIFGLASNASNYYGHVLQLSGFKNSGTVNGKSCVGGIVGECRTSTKLYILDFINEARVKGSSNIGGVVGYCKGYKGSYIQDSSTASGKLFGKSENITIN